MPDAPTQQAAARPAPPPADSAEAELEILIRARYPLISVVSWEEDRVMQALDRIGIRYGKVIFQWSINSGLARYRPGMHGAIEGKKGTKDPILALKEIETNKGDATIFVLKDFHRFMEEAPVVRGLRDLAFSLRDTYSSVVILSPVLKAPPELEKDLNVVDFPMPGREDVLKLLEQISADAAGNAGLKIDLSDDAREQLSDAAIGLTLTEMENVFAKILLKRARLTAAEAPEVYHEKRQIVRKSGLLEYIETEESMEGVGGLGNLKEWLRKRRQTFHPEARRFGLPVPKGVFFVGVQGCGKSLCAKSVSQFWRMPLLRLDMGQLFGSFVGASEENVRRAIKLAETISPCILWIDEIDKGFSGLQSSGSSDSGTTARVFATLLTWFQEKKSSVFVIATANNVEQLPPELLRQGRFDEIFFIDLPTAEERAEIFRIHLAKRRRDPSRFDLPALAAAAEGYSGAEIEQAVISALFNAYDQRRDIDQAMVVEAIGETFPLSRVMSAEIESRRIWARGRTRPAS